MFFKDIYAGPGRRSKLTGGMIILISILLVFQCFIIANALNMAIKVKVSVFWLDPYLQVEIQGADDFQRIMQGFVDHPETMAEAGRQSGLFVQQMTGATRKILSDVKL